jgi:multidrug efflux pump subunit AcrA (membrane-fusion protein)
MSLTSNRMSSSRSLAAIALVGLALLLAGCGEAQKQAAPPPPTVTVAKPVTRTIIDRDEYVGRFVAVYAVEVRARVSGYLDKVQFQDGQIVKQGDLLFTIDKRPFQNTLDQARANLDLAKSNVIFAQSDLARGQQ